MRLLGLVSGAVFIVSIVVLLAGYFGASHPAAESLAAFRHYALLVLAASLLFFLRKRRYFLAGMCILLLGFGLFSIWPQLRPSTSGEGLTLLQLNLRFDNDAAELVDFAAESGADIVTLQEVTTKSVPQLARLRGQFPYQVICPFSGVGGVAILSKFAFIGPQERGCVEGAGLVSVRLEAPFGNVTVAALHLHWPWPYGQAAQVEALLPVLEKLEGPVILAGDFNMAPWARPVARVAAASHTEVIGGMRFTKAMLGGVLQLPIDHVLVPIGLQAGAEVGPMLGADHRSVLAHIEPVRETN